MDSPTVLVVEDDAALREAITDTLELANYQCLHADSGESALLKLKKHKVDLVVSDVQMPGMNGLQLLRNIKHLQINVPIVMMTAYAKVDDAVVAMREGAIDYLSKPFSIDELTHLVQRYAPIDEAASDGIVVRDKSSLALLELAKKVARTNATVLITGPSGTGKEVLARYIHQQSGRGQRPFVAVNCAAIPETMLESLLFGYEKGAFTGATQSSPGKFELAQGGTLLLDEVTEMDIALQAKLLRVIQERQVERLGARQAIRLDVRIIATSNRDIKTAVAEGTFREDLMYRLNVFPLHWLPLAQRRDDIEPIAESLIARHRQRLGIREPVKLSESAKQQLRIHSWPGNIRELENVIQRALVLRQEGEIQASDLMLDVVPGTQVLPEQVSQNAQLVDSHPKQESAMWAEPAHSEDLGESLFMQEYRIIKQSLERHQGKRKPVAEELGISPRTLRYKLAKIRDNGLNL
ncbi:two-component system response regulator FlrC [Idiomarina fontislapidosi]|uniref:Sigma-54-dependent Fis family transcriptional regulator n=1 Tax=Idiomarina fontislapidosi TaxID=263723 RepID=A0A432XRD6_9GAMM|nr:sigma-54 dependent transcriptional regulator [Idiomarina fontislapidosi]PYE31013.1 two-component system response regulator FlrC [Idiomarina fontislapidosi]RUO51289.1 sigma-54-dependent Fis family transcriptional regulator [Idiomarina fontislapidosi]